MQQAFCKIQLVSASIHIIRNGVSNELKKTNIYILMNYKKTADILPNSLWNNQNERSNIKKNATKNKIIVPFGMLPTQNY